MPQPRTAIIALATFACLAVALSALRASAQPFPQSPAAGSTRLVGQHVTIYLQNNAAAATSRTRDSSGTDPLIRINDTPISIAGTVSAYSTDGGGRWLILTRRDSGDAWIPYESIQLIEVSTERR